MSVSLSRPQFGVLNSTLSGGNTNYYFAIVGSADDLICYELAEMGYMRKGQETHYGGVYYHATERGMDAFFKQSRGEK